MSRFSTGRRKLLLAIVAGAFGGSALLGRFAGGALMDVSAARLIGVVSLLLPAVGCLLFIATPVTTGSSFAMALLTGLGVGAEGDVLGFITSRRFGVRSFGTVYGAISGLFALGAGVGPFTTSLLLDRAGSYTLVTPAILVMLLICFTLFVLLDRQTAEADRNLASPGDPGTGLRKISYPAARDLCARRQDHPRMSTDRHFR